ncbi:hypothetical protein G3N95_01590 [Paraburkholderia sp. Tr-20389]|uniref:hypothetical protein n=1 Tax=Paraburkholderia sp. Tr-20389 TaxID=2703903 RepID=UPI00197D5640|nr:hypothetical protein [Paraburkholderia sp. Tr-20389]MBN3751616.1 hypothetical protein [Paraburkholderia sp. Tr-20389]
MGWPIPCISAARESKAPSGWLVIGLCVVCFVVGAVLTLLLWPSASGTARNPRFWACIVGAPTVAVVVLVAVIFHWYLMDVFYWAFWSVKRLVIDLAWRRWARANLAITAFRTLTPEPELAERIAGLAGKAPSNKLEIETLQGFDADLHANRTEVVIKRLLDELRPTLDQMGSRQVLRVVVCGGRSDESQDLGDAVDRHWRSNSILPHAQVEVVSEVSWLGVERYVRQQRGALLLLCAQLHDAGEEERRFTETAVGLLFEPVTSARRPGTTPVRLFRSMPTAIESMAADLRQLGDAGAVELAKLRMGWTCGLGKPEKYALTQGITDCGLALKGGANGLINLDDCIGPVGPISPWISLALVAELASYGQGAQLIALHEANTVRLAVAALAGTSVALEAPGEASRNLGAAAVLVCMSPWVAALLAAIVNPANAFFWILGGIGAAGLLAILLMFIHPLIVQTRVERDIQDAGGRMPTDAIEA